MKILAVLCLLAVSSEGLSHGVYLDDLLSNNVPNTVYNSINDKFRAALEGLKTLMKSGNETLGIPVLDPFHLAQKELKTQSKIFTGTVAVKNFEFAGLSDFTVQNADIKISKWSIAIDLFWPSIKGKTSYDVQGHLLNKINVYGTGDFDYDISGFHFSTQIKIKINFKTKQVVVESFNATEISVKDFKTKVTGLFFDDEISELASAVVSDIIPDTITDFQEEITSRLNIVLKDKANEILKKYTLDDIKGLIH